MTTKTVLQRREWTVEEKLKILSQLDKGVSLYELEHQTQGKCTRKMIQSWKKKEGELIKLIKEKRGKGKKRKRVEGGGGKLNYYLQLDKHLMNWYRSKRGLDQEDVGVHKEKGTFKGLIRVGQRFCDANKLKEPSKKWFVRFLKRNRLSLQKPVHQQKISLPEPAAARTKFHSLLRPSSHWGPKRAYKLGFINSGLYYKLL
ncbi:unnamed protein product [Didymodactylos carnosus]|uniref:Uncharacterized protein n=1 Tax=Didymodactylos carnosus TaxID=1234261 RepID=A0A814PHG2_9BILA|nr:unnamed protein product [Didymodactylos carnosus]CAF1105719.1 unnamed protein product [Didymodactylos carnosus]CAF3573919.1 unnamed protein product [Didymodactylos carnosus]CAF3870359.1 unnamed protein product [Didymodactylos carnosus]